MLQTVTENIKQEIRKDPMLSVLSALARKRRIPLFLVGGYLRDLLLGNRGKDYDFALPKEASSSIEIIEEVLGLHFFKVGKEEKNTIIYRTIQEGLSIDLAFLQGETIEEDLRKRDFTINAMAFSLRDETFHSVKEAFKDLSKKLIRTVSVNSIDQDPLRMLRAIRYSSTLEGFIMDENLITEISSKKEQIRKIPGERIKAELDRILFSSCAFAGIKSLYESTLLLTLFPEFGELENLGQGGYHHLNVLPHILLVIEKVSWAVEWVASRGMKISFAEEDWLALYYAVLFHDIGKQETYSEDEKGRVHFYFHESHSCQRAEEIMERLRFSNQLKNRILHLILHHMRILNLPGGTKEGALKRLVNQMGEDTSLLILHTLADKEASRGILSIQIDEVVESHCVRIMELFREKDLIHPSPLINGQDVMALGYSPGPRVGQILDFLRQKQVEGDIKNREEALRMLKEEFGIKG
ncbi:MAG TPA: HD domain-containing protein [Thermodesulfobacteriota bacterium]|nr:HD domain-containing protein [Thermodesulfobacteriota bacterium]